MACSPKGPFTNYVSTLGFLVGLPNDNKASYAILKHAKSMKGSEDVMAIGVRNSISTFVEIT